MIETFITMTSKGTFTMPAAVRKKLGVTKAGDKLQLTFHQKNGEVVIKKPADLRAMQKRNAALLKARGIKPLSDTELRRARQEAWGQRTSRLTGNHEN